MYRNMDSRSQSPGAYVDTTVLHHLSEHWGSPSDIGRFGLMAPGGFDHTLVVWPKLPKTDEKNMKKWWNHMKSDVQSIVEIYIEIFWNKMSLYHEVVTFFWKNRTATGPIYQSDVPGRLPRQSVRGRRPRSAGPLEPRFETSLGSTPHTLKLGTLGNWFLFARFCKGKSWQLLAAYHNMYNLPMGSTCWKVNWQLLVIFWYEIHGFFVQPTWDIMKHEIKCLQNVEHLQGHITWLSIDLRREASRGSRA